MKVSDLIEILKTFPPNSLVVTDGYEDGLEPIKRAKLINVTEVEEKQWYYGVYDWAVSSEGIDVVYLDSEAKNEDRFKV